MKTIPTLIAVLTLFTFCALARAAAPASQPAPPRVLLLLGKTFNVGEFHAAYFALRAAGYSVDIATNEPADIEAGSKDRSLDIPKQHALPLASVRSADYLALVIPGGSSPANLEKDPRSVAICQEFNNARKPIAAICHGPRLLMRAGITQNKTITSLFTLKDEAPELWNHATFRNYLDQPTVISDNLLTSRYPNDAPLFGTEMIKHFHKLGGLPFSNDAASVAILYDGLDPKNRQERWAYTHALEMVSLKSTLITSPEDAAKLADAQNFAALIIIKPSDNPAYVQLRKNFETAGKTVLTTSNPDRSTSAKWIAIGDDLAAIAAAVPRTHAPSETSAAPQTRPAKTPPVPADATKDLLDAAIVLTPGFDAAAVETLLEAFTADKKAVALLAEKTGNIPALNGSTLAASAAYTAPLRWKNNAAPLLIAPGFLWPDSLDKDARLARFHWLNTQYEKGATLVAVGFDAYYLARDAQIKNAKDMKFATSDQCVWSFTQDIGAYSPDAVRKTAPRLYTLKNAGAVPQLLKLLAEKDPPPEARP